MAVLLHTDHLARMDMVTRGAISIPHDLNSNAL